ncbi:MAG: cyclic nucleotide-binding domain-containing protein [Ignavibacteria bacterium]|nr:cyclic nucleotide-binding domain-containing protein [Ignavibacteria bacterium]
MKFYKKGETIVSEGEPKGSIFVLVEGAVGVYKNDVKISEFTQKGTVFGEMSMFLNQTRTATLKATEDAYVAEINTEIDDLFKKHPDVAKKIIINLSERLMQLTDDYWHLMERLDIEEKIRKYI